MPLCYLHTNIPDSDLKDGIEGRIAKRIGEILDKPLERIIIVVIPGVRIFRLGNTDPACNLQISSINVFDKERNPGYSVPIRELLATELNLPKERITITFHDLDKDMLG